MVGRADQARVKDLIAETITLLCKNGLHFKSQFSIKALIGITLDKDEVFLVDISETVFVSQEDQQNNSVNSEGSAHSCDGESNADGRQQQQLFLPYRSKTGRVNKRPRLQHLSQCMYSSTAETGSSSWQDRNSERGSGLNAAASLSGDCFAKIETSSLTKSLSTTMSAASEQINCQETDALSGKLNVNRTVDSNPIPDDRPVEHDLSQSNSSTQGCSHGNNLYPTIKQEPEDNNSAYNFSFYVDQGVAPYNINSLLQNQVMQKHATTKTPLHDLPPLTEESLQSSSHQEFVIQHELIENRATSHLQVKVGGPARQGGGLQFRRRSLGGPFYRMPRNHVCNLCGKAFEKKRDLRGHLAAKHHMQKEHKCDLCGKEFSYKRSLTDHMLVHSRSIAWT